MKKTFLTLCTLSLIFTSGVVFAHPGHTTTLVAQQTPPPPHQRPTYQHKTTSVSVTTEKSLEKINKYAEVLGQRLDQILATYSENAAQNFLQSIADRLNILISQHRESNGAMYVLKGLEIAINKRIDKTISTNIAGAEMAGYYMGPYEINDSTYGTKVKVTLDNNYRYIFANGIPNHPTGDFPNRNNPNTISEQSYNFTIPLNPTKGSTAKWQQIIGVAVNGVFIEPETNERVTCTNGDKFKIEAFQDYADLGFDMSNAHVQPNGGYHYHGIPEELIKTFTTDEDMVLLGFAADGFPLYYSHSNKYEPSYRTKSGTRGYNGNVSCMYKARTTQTVDANVYDGKLVEDWEYVDGLGDLDECNGIEVDGQYMYMITEDYPFVGRCVFGNAHSSFGKR